MAKGIQDMQLLYKVADMYYTLNLNLVDIGRRIGIAPMTVSRLLAKAREVGIVQIIVKKPIDNCPNLEQALKKQFGLKNVIVVKISEGMDLREQITEAGAIYLDQILDENSVLGIGIGGTTAALVDHLLERKIPGLKIFQMLGGFESTEYINSFDILQSISRKLGAEGIYLHAPVYAKDSAKRDLLYEEVFSSPKLKAVLASCTIVVTGAGSVDMTSIYVKAGVIQPSEMSEIAAMGGVGDILGQFYDAEGRVVNHALNHRVIAVPLDELRNIPEVILISGGENKILAIKAVIQGKLITTLVTDGDSAEALLGSAD